MSDPADRRLFLVTDEEWDHLQEALERPAEVKPRLAELLANGVVFSTTDDLIREYAAEAERIYEARTAGDFTWVGLLAKFARELGVMP